MEPQDHRPEFPRITIRFVQGGDVSKIMSPEDQAEMMRIMDEMMSALSEAMDSDELDNDSDDFEIDDLIGLECLDDAVHGDEQPEALAWIMNAYRKIEDERRM